MHDTTNRQQEIAFRPDHSPCASIQEAVMRFDHLVFFSTSVCVCALVLSGCGSNTLIKSSNSTTSSGQVPTVLAVAEQVNGVAPNRKQEVQFSVAMDPSTINAQSFQVTDSSGKLAQGTVSYDPDFETASFLPNPPLQPGTSYTATITSAVGSTGGMHLASPYSFTFNTRSDSDISPLIVNSVSPAANATCISADTPITITFDEAPDANTVNSTNIVVTGPGGAGIPVTMSINVATTQVVITPQTALPSGTITVTVKNVGDLADVMMAAPYAWSFSTACGGGGGGGSGTQLSFSTTTYSGTDLLWVYSLSRLGTMLIDLNDDGRDDFITGLCSSGFNGFRVRLSTADGVYGAPTCSTIPAAPQMLYDFTAGDFFGNGYIDVAAEDEKGNLYIYKNATGNGTLTVASTTMLPSGPGAILPGDFNHDGKIDLVYEQANPNGGGGTLQVLFGNGDGTFSPGPTTTFTMQAQAVLQGIGDFDGDGSLDVVAGDSSGQEIEVLYGDATGKFIPGPSVGGVAPVGGTTELRTQYQPFHVNTDRMMDLIGAPFTFTFCSNCKGATVTPSSYLDLEFGHPDRTLTSQKVPLKDCPASTTPPQVADFDGDGIPDIVVAEAPCQGPGPNTIDFMKGNGNGTFEPEQVIYTTSDSIYELRVIKAAGNSNKPGLAVAQLQDVNNVLSNPEELIMVNTTP
jgi:hypothetical protein